MPFVTKHEVVKHPSSGVNLLVSFEHDLGTDRIRHLKVLGENHSVSNSPISKKPEGTKVKSVEIPEHRLGLLNSTRNLHYCYRPLEKSEQLNTVQEEEISSKISQVFAKQREEELKAIAEKKTRAK